MDCAKNSRHAETPVARPEVNRKYPFFGRCTRAAYARISVPWLSLINIFARSPICESNGPVVSLTTHGDRILTVHFTIESIAQGQLRPSRLLLWLDDEARFSNLPAPLRRLQERGLEVKLCKNYGPHTKYYPYVESEETITQPLVTADDDILYPHYWLKKLDQAFREFPHCVSCYRARVITVTDGKVVPYREWDECRCTESSFRYLATGVSGVIYSPQFLIDLKAAGSVFEECCPKADDLWLHVQALRSGYKIRQILSRPRHFPTIPGTQRVSLYAANVVNQDGNDLQVKSTYTEADFTTLLGEIPEVTCVRGY
jgi:hypothetical protein